MYYIFIIKYVKSNNDNINVIIYDENNLPNFIVLSFSNCLVVNKYKPII